MIRTEQNRNFRKAINDSFPMPAKENKEEATRETLFLHGSELRNYFLTY